MFPMHAKVLKSQKHLAVAAAGYCAEPEVPVQRSTGAKILAVSFRLQRAANGGVIEHFSDGLCGPVGAAAI
jgi:hypothetical protein